MKQFDFYAMIGVIVPGGFMLAGASLFVPELKQVFLSEQVGIGNFGVFVIIAYAAGQLVAAMGNVFEKVWWKFWGGMPSDWPRSGKHNLIAQEQVGKLKDQISDCLGITIEQPIAELSSTDWFGITRQINAAIPSEKRAGRIDKFNANYGMNRGLAVSLLVLTILIITSEAVENRWGFLSVLGCAIFSIRMHCFGVCYARELFVEFLQLRKADSSPDG